MEKPALRVGLIGLGGVALAHLEAYRELSEVKVVAGADIRADRARELADKYGFTPYSDYRELLRQSRLDIACILSTVSSHREIAEAAADHGVHVLCEKPITLTLEDADRLIGRCRDRKVKLFYGSSYRFLPAVRRAKELIAEGQIGEVRFLTESMIGGSGPEGYEPMGFGHYPAGGPGGSGTGLVDHGIHLADIFSWLTASPIVAVQGRGQRSGSAPIVEYMVMELESGALGQLTYDSATWSSDLPSEGLFSWGPAWGEFVKEPASRRALWEAHPGSIRVHGTRGALRIYHYANQLFLRSRAGVEQIPVSGNPMPGQFAGEMASFARSIVRDEEPEVTGVDGRRALAAVLGVYESMKSGQRVTLGEG